MEKNQFRSPLQNHFRLLQTAPDSVERIFFLKVIPILSIGLALWFTSTLIYGGVLGPVLLLDFTGLIIAYVLYIVLWIVTIVLAYRGSNFSAMITFFISSFFSGVTEAPIIMWASYVLGSVQRASMIFLFSSLAGIMAVGGALYLGARYGSRLSGRWLPIIFILMILTLFLESILVWMVGFDNVIMITSGIMLVLLFATILYDGANLRAEISRSWMLGVLTVFIDMIVVIIRLFIIIVQLLADNN